MPIIQQTTYIAASIDFCFNLARTVEVHTGKQLLTTQKPVCGTTAGIMELGDSVI